MMNLKSFFAVLVLFAFAPVTSAQADFEGSYVGDMVKYRAKYEDTFIHLARDYKLGYVEMRAANPNVDPWLPGAGTTLTLPTRHILPDAPHEGIVINLPEMRLYAFINGDAPPTTFPLGVGREGLETPVGSTTVVRKKAGPTWRPTPRMRSEDPLLKAVYPPGPDNPLGTHAIYLGWPTYAIHGTNRPFGIGRRISSGCIRMYPEDISRFFEMIPVGTKVTVVDHAVKLAWIEDKLYIEAHPSLEHSLEMEETARIAAPKLSEEDMERIIKIAGEHKDKIRWAAVRTAIRERKGYPIYIARRSGGYDTQESAELEDLDEADVLAMEEAEIEATKNEAREVLEEIYGTEDESEDLDQKASYAAPAAKDYEMRTLNP